MNACWCSSVLLVLGRPFLVWELSSGLMTIAWTRPWDCPAWVCVTMTTLLGRVAVVATRALLLEIGNGCSVVAGFTLAVAAGTVRDKPAVLLGVAFVSRCCALRTPVVGAADASPHAAAGGFFALLNESSASVVAVVFDGRPATVFGDLSGLRRWLLSPRMLMVDDDDHRCHVTISLTHTEKAATRTQNVRCLPKPGSRCCCYA